MGHALPKAHFTPADFLAWDATQSARHEFFNGEVFAMAGAEARHVSVTLNVFYALRQHLSGTRCRIYGMDMKLSVSERGDFFYPDGFVTCAEADRAERLMKREPSFIFEVLSPSTAAFDRGDKFASYRTIKSLKEYALIDIDRRSVDVYRVGLDGLWVLHPFSLITEASTATFASVDLSISGSQLFADIDD
jgi:Uma2 family endonuclease